MMKNGSCGRSASCSGCAAQTPAQRSALHVARPLQVCSTPLVVTLENEEKMTTTSRQLYMAEMVFCCSIFSSLSKVTTSCCLVPTHCDICRKASSGCCALPDRRHRLKPFTEHAPLSSQCMSLHKSRAQNACMMQHKELTQATQAMIC